MNCKPSVFWQKRIKQATQTRRIGKEIVATKGYAITNDAWEEEARRHRAFSGRGRALLLDFTFDVDHLTQVQTSDITFWDFNSRILRNARSRPLRSRSFGYLRSSVSAAFPARPRANRRKSTSAGSLTSTGALGSVPVVRPPSSISFPSLILLSRPRIQYSTHITTTRLKPGCRMASGTPTIPSRGHIIHNTSRLTTLQPQIPLRLPLPHTSPKRRKCPQRVRRHHRRPLHTASIGTT